MAVEKLVFNSKSEWIDARKHYVSATEVAKLAQGGEKVWVELREQKAGTRPTPDLSHIPAMWHGTTREPVIAQWVADKASEHKLAHSDALFVRDGKYAATPDMISSDRKAVGEIKTIAETRLASLKRWPMPIYYDQIQWQLFVTGAEVCVFAWEPYVREGDKLIPWAPDRGMKTIMRDEKRIGELKDIADVFLAGENGVDIGDDVHLLFSELRDILKQEQELKPLLARKAEIEDELRVLAAGESKAWDAGDLRVSVSAPTVSQRFDRKRFFEQNPDIDESNYLSESKSKARVRVTFNG